MQLQVGRRVRDGSRRSSVERGHRGVGQEVPKEAKGLRGRDSDGLSTWMGGHLQ